MNEQLKQYLHDQLKIASEELTAPSVGSFLAGKASGKIHIIKETLKKIEEIEGLAKKSSE
jgi:hypothetical protein